MSMTRISTLRRAQGFILIEVMIAMAIFTAMVTYGLYLQNLASEAEQGRSLGRQYAAINTAVGNYMVTHYAALEKLQVGCSTTTFKVGMSGSFTPMACGLQISSTVSIANGMQPTVAELIAAGYLPPDKAGAVVGVPSLPMDSVVAEANASTGAASSTPAKGRLFINIDRVCLATHTANPASVSAPQAPDASTGLCDPQTTTTLTSLVFNTQPYTFNNVINFGYANRINAAWTEIGADAAMANITKGGELKGANFQILNPVRSAADIGMAGIVAVRNGYGAAYAKNHARVDGSNPPTADWSFANNSIKDVATLTAQSVDAQTVAAKVVSVEALKLGDRTEGGPCDASKENVSFGSETILLCKLGRWTQFSSKGAVNGLEYYEFVLNKYSGQSMNFQLTHCPTTGCDYSLFQFDNGNLWLSTNLRKDEWQPVLLRFRDRPTASDPLNILFGHMTQTDFGFNTDGGNYSFSVRPGTGLLSQLFGSEELNIVGRFYQINQ